MRRNELRAPSARVRCFPATRSAAWSALSCLVAVLGLIAGRPADAAQDEAAAEMQTPACPNGICRGLGHAFFLPGINGFDPPSTGNDFFVDARLGSCASLSPPDGSATRQFQNSESMEELTRKTSSSFELSGSYTTARLTARGSVSAMTGADTSTTQRMTSTHIDITTPTRTVDFNQRGRDCFSKDNVDPSDVQQFEALPLIHADRAGQQSEWDPYVVYLQRLGSHIQVRQVLGSRFQRWESSNASTSDILNILKAKACAAVEGKNPSNAGWSVDGCAAYSSEQRERASQTHSEWRQIVMGGTGRTRVALTQEVSKERVDAFIASGARGDQPIRYGFKPVWELWIQIYSPLCSGGSAKDCGNLQRAYNLKTAYEGVLAIGCPEQKDGNGGIVQSIAPAGEPNSLGIQAYGCFAERTGCRSNSDCRAGAAGTTCYCYGASCLDQGEGIAGTTLFRTRVRGSQEGGFRHGVNNSCRLRGGIGNTCSCNTTWTGGLPRRDLFRQPPP
jgi:hypothetical protein